MNTQTFPTLDFEIKNGRIRVVGGKDDPTAGMTKEERLQYYINNPN
jgi:hypothetical protein